MKDFDVCLLWPRQEIAAADCRHELRMLAHYLADLTTGDMLSASRRRHTQKADKGVTLKNKNNFVCLSLWGGR